MSDSFVHLHVHSDFSFMDGAAYTGGLIERVRRLGMPAVALTDHQGLYGAIRFYRAALAAGVRPILGVEVVVEACGVVGDECDQPPAQRLAPPPPAGFGRASASGFHLTLLVKDITGYRNLCRLLSRAHLREEGGAGPPRSVIALSDLKRRSEGLIGLSGCERGELGASVLADLPWRAKAAAKELSRCFAPGDFYVELTHSMTPGALRYISALVDLAGDLHLPVVATNDVHYLQRADFRLHDVLSAVGARTSLPGPLDRPNAELYLKSASEMRRLFAGTPAACDATLEIAERCDLDLGLGEFHFPAVEVPRGETAYSMLSKLAWRGVEERYRPVTPEAVRRLQHELAVIEELGFSEYFLVVRDIVEFAKRGSIRCSGRGSAGDSIVTYALGITDADPVAHDLLFERFLNPARRQMPDIDVDFDSARRDEVIDYIYKRFGAAHVAMVATVCTMTAKSAVRTAAKALGHSPERVNEMSRHLPWTSARRIREVLATYPECRTHPLREPGHELLLDITEQLDGCAMHLGTHLGGFIITREPIETWMPLQWAAKGVVVSQYDKDDIEALGLVKMDILGLRMHTAISEAVSLARERVGEANVPEPFLLPHDDPHVYATIAAADTVGMFQLESSGQRNLAHRLRERTFEDIIAAISLFRPGPLEAEMITPFIRRRHGIEPVVVPHPSMGPVLADTYGVIIYQEQVLQVAKAVAGFTLAEADLLRRAMTKGRSRGEMEALHGEFVERACALGCPREAAEEVFRQLQGFAAYGFNKAHAACFAVVSYASAWLKTYYPAELAAAILNSEPMGFYSPRLMLDDARRHGIDAAAAARERLRRRLLGGTRRARHPRRPQGPAAHDGAAPARDGDRARTASVRRPDRLPAADAGGGARRGEPDPGRRARRARHHGCRPAAHPRRAAGAAAGTQGGARARGVGGGASAGDRAVARAAGGGHEPRLGLVGCAQARRGDGAARAGRHLPPAGVRHSRPGAPRHHVGMRPPAARGPHARAGRRRARARADPADPLGEAHVLPHARGSRPGCST